MKKVLTIVFIFFMVFGLYAQAIDAKLLDLSSAKVSIAGPQSVYIRSIYYDGKELSVLLKYNGNNGATVYGPYYGKDKLLQDYYNLGYAKLSVSGNNEILVSGIIIGDQAYSGILKWTGGSTLVVDSYWQSKMPETKELKIANLSKKLLEIRDKYEKQISDLKGQIAKLKSSRATMAVSGAAAAPAVVKAAKKPERTVLSGFSGGKSLSGKWSVSYNSAEQSNTGSKFAKYSIPLYQNQKLISYSFDGRISSSSGWVGYGLHFLASGEQTGNGYGFGRSYLVWLTRDPIHFQNNKTYVELYESYNDVKMVPLARVRITQPITSTLTTKVLYDRSSGKITVSVNGSDVLSYTLDSPIWSGDKVALRSLGGHVRFSNLSIKTE